MSKFDYDQEAKVLSEVIDIAIDAFKSFPPKGFNEYHIQHFVNVYSSFKSETLKPEPRFRNSTSLKSTKKDVLVIFQESSGEAIEYFWKKVNERNIDYKRENKMVKILKRKKIKTQEEYDFVIDVIVPYEQTGLINESETAALGKMLDDYQQRAGR